MSNGRHFNPPTPAYRPRDPFASIAPRSAELIPSSENTKPPPSRPRPVRVDSGSERGASSEGGARAWVAPPASMAPAILANQLPEIVPKVPTPRAEPPPAAEVKAEAKAARPVAEHRPAAAPAAPQRTPAKVEPIKAEPARVEAPLAKVEPVKAPKVEAPKAEPPKAKAAPEPEKVEPAKAKIVESLKAKAESLKAKAEPPKAPEKVEAAPKAKVEPPKAEPPKAAPEKVEAAPKAKIEPPKVEPVKAPPAKAASRPPAKAAAKLTLPTDLEDPEELIPAVPEIPEESLGDMGHGRGKGARRKTAPPKAHSSAVEPEEPAHDDAEAANIVLAEGEELRRCEWERCGKLFPVKVTGRTVVRRFCSGTCRGRASEARTGKRQGT